MALKTPKDVYKFDYRQLRIQANDWHFHPLSEVFSFETALEMTIEERKDDKEWQQVNASRWAAMKSFHNRFVKGELEWREMEKLTEEALGNFYCWAAKRRAYNAPQNTDCVPY